MNLNPGYLSTLAKGSISECYNFTSTNHNDNATFSCKLALNKLASIRSALPYGIRHARNLLLANLADLFPNRIQKSISMGLQHAQLGNRFVFCVLHNKEPFRKLVNRYLDAAAIKDDDLENVFTVRLYVTLAPVEPGKPSLRSIATPTPSPYSSFAHIATMPTRQPFEVITDSEPDTESEQEDEVPRKKTRSTQTEGGPATTDSSDAKAPIKAATQTPAETPADVPTKTPKQPVSKDKVRFVYNPRRINHFGSTHTISCSVVVKPFEDPNKIGAITPILLDARKCLYDELCLTAPGLHKPYIRCITFRAYHPDLFPAKSPLFLRFSDIDEDAYIPISTRVAGIEVTKLPFSLDKPFTVFLDINTHF